MAILILDDSLNVLLDDPNAPSGGVALTGEAGVVVSHTYRPAGRLMFTGLSSVAASYTYRPAGRLTFTGLASAVETNDFFAVGAVRGRFIGLAPVTVAGSPIASVRATLSGLASVALSGPQSMEGGLSLSGVAPVTVAAGQNPTGQMSLSGDASVEMTGNSGSIGRLTLGGVASVEVAYTYEPVGALSLIGLNALTAHYEFGATGGFVLSDESDVTFRDEFSQTFSWQLHEKVEFENTFTWGVGERPFSFYRVTGKCKPARCPPLSLNGCPSDSKFTYVVNIYARNLAEVCRKLIDRNMIFPIAAIEKFSIPASKLDYTDDTDTECNKLTVVTPAVTFLPCQELMVDYNAKVHMGVQMRVITAFVHEASGSIGFAGSVFPFDQYEAEGESGPAVTGEATCEQSDYHFLASGSIGFNGNVEDLTVPVWVFEPSGSLAAVVDGEVMVVQEEWFSEPVGGFGVSGSENGTPTMAWVPTGGFSKGESTAIGYDDYLPFIVEASGRLFFRGDAPNMPGQYSYDGSGAVAFTGLTRFVSPSYTIQPEGRLLFRNGPGSPPNTSSNEGIEATFGGSATVVWSPRFSTGGTLGLSGTADVIYSAPETGGNLGFSGTADCRSSDLGVIAMSFGADFRIKTGSETVLFAYEEAPAAERPVRRITTRCCTQSLPLRLWVEHPLANSNHFGHFLRRNNLLIDNPVEVYYNAVEKTWYNTIHLEGFAPDFPTIESWSITFGWGCQTVSDIALDDSDLWWKFSVMAVLRSVNNPTIPQRVSKMVAGFDPTRVCFNNKMLSFPFIFDTAKKTMNPTAVQTLVYVDDIGLFKSPTFVKSPLIRFKVSEIVADITQAVVDIGPAITNSQLTGVSISRNILSSLPVG